MTTQSPRRQRNNVADLLAAQMLGDDRRAFPGFGGRLAVLLSELRQDPAGETLIAEVNASRGAL